MLRGQIVQAPADDLEDAHSSGAFEPNLMFALGLEKIHFFWYVRKISGLALVGYFAGAGVYLLQHQLLH